MKRVIYLIAIALLSTSCIWQEDRIFDLSAQQRQEALANQCKEALLAAPYGWELSFDSQSASRGDASKCYHFYMKFNADNSVVMYSDIKEVYKLTPTVSSYAFTFVAGATLTFDTYGMISELGLPDGTGESVYNGENDFVILSVSSDRIQLRGLKEGVKVDLIKADAEHVADYFQSVRNFTDFFKSRTNSPFFPSLLFADGTGICVKVTADTRWITFITPNADKTDTLMHRSSIDHSIDGFNLLNPYVVGGKNLQKFIWNDVAQNFHADIDPQSAFVYTDVTPFPFGHTVDKYKDKSYRLINYSNQMKTYCMNTIATMPQYTGIEFKWHVAEEIVENGVARKDTVFHLSIVFQPDNQLPDYNNFGISGATVQREDQVAFIDSGERTGNRMGQLKNNMYVKRLTNEFFYDATGLTVYEEGNYMYLISKADSRNWLQFIRM
jgi:hypothetical protein